jgi:hypothetical protein
MSSDEPPIGQNADEHDAGSDARVWGIDPPDAYSDPTAANLFTAEIEHVDASDWDVDTALIWGDEIDDGGAGLDGSMGLDFPL